MAQDIVKQIHSLLLKSRKTVAVAESCTGGLTSQLLTQYPGSSKYFLLGVVAYSNRNKVRILKIPSRLISRKGAVSAEVAKEMAQKARKLGGTDLGIGITGIAGPGGATLPKPVGTVFIAVAANKKGIGQRFKLKGNRTEIRKQSALKALALLRKLL